MKAHIHKGDSKETRRAKRSFNRKLRKREYTKTHNSNLNKSKLHNELTITYANKYIQKFCKVNNISQWVKTNQKEIKLSDNFSLFEHPHEVLVKLLELLHYASQFNTFPTINVKGRISFGALYLIDNICWEIGKNRRWSVRFKNIEPEDQVILSHLRSLHINNVSSYQDDKAYLVNETVPINRKDALLVKQKYKEKATEITDMVIQGMRENNDPNFELSHKAYQAISSTICEHFDNIYEHVPEAKNGYLCGFYNKDLKEITILIFNFGLTIKESFDNKEIPTEIKKEIDSVIGNYKKFDWFRLSKGFTEENAMTLLALQEGVSSKINYDPSRGFGIMDYIEHCFNLNKNCKVSIISGKTAIKIDDRYSIVEKYFIDRERRIIAFNEDNDIYTKPDNKYIKDIGPYFPGVIIETKIPLC
jgi:hypothetical protein